MHVQKIFVILALLFFGITSHCSAKLIYDNTGRISFETSDKWFYAPGEGDMATYHLHSIGLDKDTAIILKQSKYQLKYATMKDMPMEEKSVLRDSILQHHIEGLKSKGYSVTINKTDCYDDSIIAGFTARKGGSTCRLVVAYFIKDYACYSLCYMGTDETREELVKTVATLKIDGTPFLQWIRE